ncbi:MAG TPA: serine hydrolase domain-containing protein [bacterium]|nr:serine hydrolase domain-containing protein [bacterium]HPG45711.1 serine hydrolase domain-containing protein [bacterium]HPM97510.1 serine hydrolase domain-containing protein [bacterium]
MRTTKNVFICMFFLILIQFAALLAQDLMPAKPEDVGLSSDRLQRLSAVIQGYVDQQRLPGAVVLVARHDKVAYFRPFGYQDMGLAVPMQEGTIFRIASQSKAITSVGVMILQEQGRLLINDPVGKYLPEFAKTQVATADGKGGYSIVDAKRPITVRDLLTHTAGISYGNGPAKEMWQKAGIQGWYFADRDEPIGDTISRLASLPFDAQPGEQWIYGYSTDILGALIEKVSGQTLAEFLDDQIFQPLGMIDTHFYLPAEKKDRLAVVYSIADDGSLVRAPEPGDGIGQGAYVQGPRKSTSGGAGLLSTARDYARFLQMLLNGGELDGNRLLSRKSVELMTANHISDIEYRDGRGFGLGLEIVLDVGEKGQPGSKGEYGWGGAYHSIYWVDPLEDLLVVYFTQVIPATGLDDHDKLHALVHQAIID